MSLNSAHKIELRETIDVTMEQLSTMDYSAQPELIRLKLDSITHPVDIGVIAYSIRDFHPNIKMMIKGIPVVKQSLMEDRKEFLIYFFEFLTLKNYRDDSIINTIRDTKTVMRWLDTNGYSNALSSPDKAKDAYRAYSQSLYSAIHVEPKIPRNRAAALQYRLKQIITIRFDVIGERVCQDTPTLTSKTHEKDAPEQKNILMMFEVFLHIASAYNDFFTNKRDFPFLLKMPDWEAYVFPTYLNQFISPFCIEENLAYNYKEGRLNTIDEMIHKKLLLRAQKKLKAKHEDMSRHSQESIAHHEIQTTQSILNDANINKHHRSRLELATLAMQSYFHLFQFLTAANPTQTCDFRYDTQYDSTDILKSDFTAVKFRAGMKVVTFNIESRTGLSIFKEYLRLRNEVLRGQHFEYLFFNLTKDLKPIKVDPRRTTRIYNRLKGRYIASDATTVTSNDIRVNKTLILHNLGVRQEIIAGTLQHSPETSGSTYTRTTHDTQHSEYNAYWSAMHQINVVQDDLKRSSSNIPSGHCSEINNPIPISGNVPITPECKTQFGCLYCTHYLCHADKEDAHKLLSILYVATEIRRTSKSIKDADSALLDLCLRIREVIEKLKSKSEESRKIIESTEKEVFEYQVLTPFWELKLQRHEELMSL